MDSRTIVKIFRHKNRYYDAKRRKKQKEIFFVDESMLYAILTEWEPGTVAPPFVHLRLKILDYDHDCGLRLTPLQVFYRIFLRRRLSKNWAKRPRFLTPERRARINRRCKERREADARV